MRKNTKLELLYTRTHTYLYGILGPVQFTVEHYGDKSRPTHTKLWKTKINGTPDQEFKNQRDCYTHLDAEADRIAGVEASEVFRREFQPGIPELFALNQPQGLDATVYFYSK